MSTVLHGGYDQVVEISAEYLIAQAQERLTVPDVVIDETTATDALKGRIAVSVHKIWLGSCDERYGPAGSWVASAPSALASRLIIAIDLVTGTTGADRLLVSKIRNIAIPADEQRLDLRAGVVLAIPIVAEQLHVRPGAGSPFPDESVPAVALKLAPVVTTGTDPGSVILSSRIDEPRLRQSPMVRYLVDLAQRIGADPEALVITPLLDELETRIHDAVKETLATTADPLIEEPGRVSLYAATDAEVTDVQALVQPSSLRVLMQLGGPGGDASLITTSLLGARDALGICVNGTSLLRDQLRGVLLGIFDGLDAGDFATDQPCTVSGSVPIQMGGSLARLTYLQVGIAENEDVVIWFHLDVPVLEWHVRVEVEVPVSLNVERSISQGRQALSIIPKIGTADYGVVAFVDVPIVSNIIDGSVTDRIGNAVRDFEAPQPIQQALPSGTELRVTSVSLHQDDAPTGQRTTAPPRLIGIGDDAVLIIEDGLPPGLGPARWRDHDLVITLASREYPDSMEVGCVTLDSDDPDRRIDSLGGTYERGKQVIRWSFTIDDAIAYLRGGGSLTVAPGTAQAASVVVVEGSKPYLRTNRDTGSDNNLESLPRCPPDGEAPIFGLAGRPTRDDLSETNVHWRDVVPIGDKGDEVVAKGRKVASDERVVRAVVELVDRQGMVLASAPPGVPVSVPGAGATLRDDPAGGRDLEVEVHWWFDAWHACRYRVRYVVAGPHPDASVQRTNGLHADPPGRPSHGRR